MFDRLSLTGKRVILGFAALAILILIKPLSAQDKQAHNPIIFADVPDMAMIRVGDVYYMSSTTMHMSPGVPIMKSTDLVNWDLVNYAYDTLADVDALNLDNGKSSYGRGSWASCRQQARHTFSQPKISRKVHGKCRLSNRLIMIIHYSSMMTAVSI